MQELRRLIAGGMAQRMFPCAVVYASCEGAVLVHEAFGRHTYEDAARPASPGDLFDLASVTKLFTTTVVLRLVERGLLHLDDAVATHVPEVRAAWTVADVLAHRTGTTAALLSEAMKHGVRPCEPGQEEALWRVIFGCKPVVALAEGQCHYSDVDLLLAQAVCERAAGRRLDELMAAEVLAPLGLADTCFCPTEPRRCVPTELDSQWRHRLVAGEVHDEMAHTLGGVAGHAGLFATAADVGRFGEAWLGLGGVPLLADPTRRLAFASHSADFGLGWRHFNASLLPSLASHGAIGHLGFTGTSLFLFPRHSAVLVVLANRVHPTRDAAPSRLPLLARVAEQVAAWAEHG